MSKYKYHGWAYQLKNDSFDFISSLKSLGVPLCL